MAPQAHDRLATTHTGLDRRDEASTAFEELVEEFGPVTMILVCVSSTIGQAFTRLGGEATLRVIQVLIRRIVFSPNPQLEAEVIAYCTGVLPDTNGTRIAEKHGRERATVSIRARKFIRAWNLPPGPHMKTEAACEVYALTNQPRVT
jgi:hypothetical protein